MNVMNSSKFGEMPPGTVMAFNGHRKYFYVYSPNNGHAHISADYLGLDDSDDEGVRAAAQMKETLLTWLERLMDGSLPLGEKKKVDKWPDMVRFDE